jgi:hypothetical protein
MCFSAEASFGAAAVLLPAGAYCVAQAVRKDRRLVPLALVPAAFAAQQVAEGFVWRALDAGDPAGARAPALAFLFVAMIGWPVWNGFAAVCANTDPPAKSAIRLLFVLSLAWAWVYGPVFRDPDTYLSVGVSHHSIRYGYSNLPVYGFLPVWGVRGLYLVSVAVPWALAWHRHAHVRVLGLLFALSILVTQVAYAHAFASVWCFFAALVSAYLVVVFRALPDPRMLGERE